MDDCIGRALYLQSAVNEFVEKEIDNWHVARRRRQKALRPSIVDDRLTTDDWEVLKAYHEILQPIKKSTNILQGQIGGRFGAIWQVLPQFEILLSHLEEQRQRHLPLRSQRTAPSPPQPSQLPASLDACIEIQQKHIQGSDEIRTEEHETSRARVLLTSQLNSILARTSMLASRSLTSTTNALMKMWCMLPQWSCIHG